MESRHRGLVSGGAFWKVMCSSALWGDIAHLMSPPVPGVPQESRGLGLSSSQCFRSTSSPTSPSCPPCADLCLWAEGHSMERPLENLGYSVVVLAAKTQLSLQTHAGEAFLGVHVAKVQTYRPPL